MLTSKTVYLKSITSKGPIINYVEGEGGTTSLDGGGGKKCSPI